MRDLGSSVLESRREGSRLAIVVMGFLVKGGLSEESGLRRGRRDEETSAARSRKGRGFGHPSQDMLIYSRNGGDDEERSERVELQCPAELHEHANAKKVVCLCLPLREVTPRKSNTRCQRRTYAASPVNQFKVTDCYPSTSIFCDQGTSPGTSVT